jgi:hypothetical protein
VCRQRPSLSPSLREDLSLARHKPPVRHQQDFTPRRVNETAAKSPLTVTIADLPHPVLVGFADRCAVRVRGSMFEFVFFEDRAPGDANVVARLVTAPEDLASLWASVEAVYPALCENVSAAGLAADVLSDTAPTSGDQAAIHCTVIAIARAGSGAIMECFYANARSVHQATTGKGKLRIEPIFAIQMPITLVIAFLQYVQRQLPHVRAQAIRMGTAPQ